MFTNWKLAEINNVKLKKRKIIDIFVCYRYIGISIAYFTKLRKNFEE